jgi:hypothetical protein
MFRSYDRKLLSFRALPADTNVNYVSRLEDANLSSQFDRCTVAIRRTRYRCLCDK